MFNHRIARYLVHIVLMVFLALAATLAYAQESISVGDTVEATSTTRVEYSFDAEAGSTYVIALNASDFDPYLILNDADGVSVSEDDDSGGSLNSLITFTPATSGSYTIVVAAAFSGDPDGAYTLSLSQIETQSIAVGETVTLTPDGSSSFLYTFSGEQGQVVNIFAISRGDEDTRMALTDPSGSEIASDDDGGSGTNPYIRRISLPETGTYSINLSSFSGNELTAILTLTVEPTELVELGTEPIEIVLGGDLEQDVVLLPVEAGVTYRIFVDSDELDTNIDAELLRPGESFASTRASVSGVSSFSFDFAAARTEDMTLRLRTYSYLSSGDVTYTVRVEIVE